MTGPCLILSRTPVVAGPPPPPSTIKWNPHHYMASFAVLEGGDSVSKIQDELDDCIADAAIVDGIKVFATMALFETAFGVYDFSVTDAIIAQLSPTDQNLVVQLNFGVFNSNGSPSAPQTNNTFIIPNYILNNASLYGAGLYGSSGVTPTGASGFYVQQTGAWCLNLMNAGCFGRIQALANAMGAHYNGNSRFEGIVICAWDVMSPYPGISPATYYSSIAAIGAAFVSAFPNTNIWAQLGSDSAGGANAQPLTQTLVQGRVMPGSSDVIGATGFNANYCALSPGLSAAPRGSGGTFTSNYDRGTGSTLLQFTTGQIVTANVVQFSDLIDWSPAVTGSPVAFGTTQAFAPSSLEFGIQAWLGISSPGSGWTPPSTPLTSLGHAGLDIQSGDICSDAGNQVYPIICTPLDICSALNNLYNASHAFWVRLTATETSLPQAQWQNLKLVLAANPLTNTSYPSSYP